MTKPTALCSSALLLVLPGVLFAAESTGAPSWRPQTLWAALGQMVIFAAVGILAAVVGYKVFDKCTPGDLNREIIENKNVAAALIGAAVILGVCIVVAASMIG